MVVFFSEYMKCNMYIVSIINDESFVWVFWEYERCGILNVFEFILLLKFVGIR